MITFSQTATPNLYFLPAATLTVSAEQRAPAEPYRIAFWVDDAAAINSSNPSLSVTWIIEKGIYLFLKVSPVEDAAIVLLSDRIREFLLTPAVCNARFLWIDNPTDPVFQWKFQVLTMRFGDGALADDALAVERLTFLDFRNYRLAIDRGVACRLNADSSGFVFAPNPSVHLVPGGNSADPGNREPFYFATGYGAHSLKGIEVSDAGEALMLPLTGKLAGCLTFALTLQNPLGKTAFNELVQMDITLRMFFKSANPLLDPSDSWSGFAELNHDDRFLVSNHRYPFLGEDGEAASHYSQQADGSQNLTQNLTLYATLDPLQPLNEERSYFAFVAPGDLATLAVSAKQHAPLSLPSYYRTNLGYTIHVTPHGYEDCRLIFAERWGRSLGAFDAPLYLVPHGSFTLSVPDYDPPIPNGKDFPVRDEDDLLCGIAGIEYIQLSSKHINVLRFTAGKPAFTPDFVPNQIVETDQAEQRLDERATTAWGAIAHVDAANFPIYFSQPQQSLLYRASAFQDGDGDLTDDLLRFLEVPVTGLPPEKALPLFPYGGITGRLIHYQQMEEQLLNPQRRKQIRALAQDDTLLLGTTWDTLSIASNATARYGDAMAFFLPDVQVGTTAQGLLATYSSNFEMLDSLLLAQDTEGKALNLWRLERRSPLRLAFQSSQMFLVITNPQSIQSCFPDNQLTIQGWTFDLNPERWRQKKGDTDTVLIFKFIDKPLIEALKDLALWEQPQTFVGGDAAGIKTVRDRLVEKFEGAIATLQDPNSSEKDRASAAPLASIASSISWSGMIAFNVALPPTGGLPPELRALECGIQDGANLYAQYVGSNGTPVLPENGELVAKQSSLFGLLDYQDTSVPETGLDGYAFQVASLRVQFQNSQIMAFSSDLNLTLDRLFDEATQLLNSRSGRNIVLLKGFTEKHDGVITYAFNFSGENYFALPNSHILNNVDIVKATFSTDPPGADPTLIIGRFTLWGRLNFRDLEVFDGFSFGSDALLSDQALQASNVLNRSARALNDDYQNGIDHLTAARTALNNVLATLAENSQFLQFSKLTLVMECQHSEAAGATTFKADSSQILFDMARSQARPHSLYSKFPLKLVNFVHFDADLPQSKPKGYSPVKTPLGGGTLPDRGFGLNFELNLGSLGALAGAAQLVVNLLWVWEPNQDGTQEQAKTFVGLRLPGVGGDALGFPLQSVLKLSFKNVEMLLDQSQLQPAYLLKIKNVALKFFVLSFPPNGQTEIVIFGNPDAIGSNDAIGWYAAYAKAPPTLSGQAGGRSSPA